MDNGFREVFGQSLKENDILWKKMEELRQNRTEIIHAGIRRATFEDANHALRVSAQLFEWMGRKLEGKT